MRLHNTIKALGALMVTTLLGTAVVSQAAPAPAGTTISNQATATYFNSEFGVIERVRSNTVSATVLPVPAFEVTGGETLRLTRGVEGSYSYRLTNTGNVPLSVSAIIQEEVGDDFDVSGTLYHDVNSNGIIDSGEPRITDMMPVDLMSGASIPLIYVFMTPSTVIQDDRSVSTLVATAVPMVGEDSPLTERRDGITLIDDSNLRLQKQATYNQESGEIEYALLLRNNSGRPVEPYAMIDGQPIIVDGVPRSLVLVQDEIPLNTTFSTVVSTGGMDTYYHLSNAADFEFTATAPSDPLDIEAIVFATDEAFDVSRSADLTFTVTVHENAGNATIQNTAIAYVDDGTQVTTNTSNEVQTDVAAADGTLSFYTPTFDAPIDTTSFDEEVAVELVAGVCNATRDIDRVVITITTALSGDREVVNAFETGPNTGIFRTSAVTVRQNALAIVNNNVLEPEQDDAASASATCEGQTLQDTVSIEPGGYVFDAISNDPVGGATVMLFNAGQSGTPIAQTTTAQNGFFSFADIAPGTYRVQILPPDRYSFPSAYVSFDGFGRTVDARASYGTTFTFDGGPLSDIDVPLDPTDVLPLTLSKAASRSEVRRGEYVVYTLEASNLTGQGLTGPDENSTDTGPEIVDTLPPGFIYVAGSTVVDGERVGDPAGAPGQTLTFTLEDTLRPESSVQIEYTVRVGPTSGQGRRTNTAILSGRQARTNKLMSSQPARAIVEVDDRGGVFADEAVIIGRVFLDMNGDGIQNQEDDEHEFEPGIPGVKLVTSNGLSVVTDEQGRYSLFGLRPNTQVLAVQKSTLPVGGEIALLEVDDARQPGSRFIDMKRGELRAEDFPVVWSENVERAVMARRAEFERLAFDESLLRDDLPLTFDGGVTDLSRRNESALDTTTDVDRRVDDRSDAEPQTAERPTRRSESEEQRKTRLTALIPTLERGFGIVGMEDEQVTDYASIDVLLKSPVETDVKLLVNGEIVEATKIGAKLIDKSRGIQLLEYIAVPLAPGKNEIKATVTDPFGNERGGEVRTVYAPGKPAGLQIIAPESATANASARVPVVLRVVDADGRLVRAPVTVTLDADRGKWDVRDIRSQNPGLQTFIDNGEATVDFIPPNLVGSETLRVSADFGDGEATIAISPDLGERTFVGIIEGAVRLDGGDNIAGLMDSDDLSSFEETTEGVRGQLYLKGRILGDSLLTLRYDSDQDTNERLFRDINRDDFYPVYGDNSERGFDAQSSSKLFVKVEREQSYILYGDIAVEPEAEAIRLGAFRRSLTGGKARYQKGPISITVFAAETELNQRIVEVNSRGVSGPYDVDLDGLRDGSEIVEIITRDRDQPSRIIDVQSQLRFTDYSLDYFSGALIFNRPIPLSDDDLNPVSIRVTYETEDSQGDDYIVYGGEASYAVTDNITVGYRELRTTADDGNDEQRTIRSAYIDAQINERSSAQAEVTNSRNGDGDDGFGYRVSYDYRAGSTSIHAEAAHTDDEFDVPGSYVSSGRDEARITGQHQLDELTGISGDALYSNDNTGDNRRYGAEVRVTRAITNYLDGNIGMRAVRTDAANETTDVLSGIAGLRYRPPQVPGASFIAEFEQDFVEFGNWRFTTGADYQWRPEIRFYALNELSTTESGHFGIGDGRSTNFTTKVGAEFTVMENVHGFSEYRDGGSGTGNGVANGLRTTWDVNQYTTLRASLEHIEPVKEEQERRTAFTWGMDYEDDLRGLLIRTDIEWDRNEDGSGVFSNFAFGYKVDDDFTLLLRNRFAYDDKGAENRFRDRLRLGLAYRPVDENRLRVLGWYEYEMDKQENREQSHRWSIGGQWTHSEDFRSNIRYAGEHTQFRSDFVDDSNTLHMLRFGTEYEFANDRFALGGNVAVFTDEGFDNYTVGLGAEVKVAVTEGVQVGIGYNHVELDEDRIRHLYESGFYVRAKLKLDDGVWDGFSDVTQDFYGVDGQ